jgi:hypothetical protein
VTKSDGGMRVFEESKRGLFYLDTVGPTKKFSTVMVNTVADNKASFTNRAYARAALAQNIQKMIGCPTTKEFLKITSYTV